MGELQKARESGEYEQLLIEEFGDIQKARKGLLGRIAGLQDVLITLGNTTESMSKIAGEKVLMGRISDSKARAHIIRNKVGTPNIYRKGTVTSLTNTLFMYSKVAIAGYRADFDSAFSKKSAGGWWEGHMRFIGIPRILMWMAANGFLGELLEEWFDKIPGLRQGKLPDRANGREHGRQGSLHADPDGPHRPAGERDDVADDGHDEAGPGRQLREGHEGHGSLLQEPDPRLLAADRDGQCLDAVRDRGEPLRLMAAPARSCRPTSTVPAASTPSTRWCSGRPTSSASRARCST